MIYLGIDPGLNGALAILDNTSSVRPSAFTFTSILDMKGWIIQEDLASGVFATIEGIHAISRQRAADTFARGQNLGEWLGLLTGLGIPYQLIPPQRWQKEMMPGKPLPTPMMYKGPELTDLQTKENKRIDAANKKKIKAHAASVAAGLWPDVDFRRTARCEGPHDGKVDAALLAEYGRRMQGRK